MIVVVGLAFEARIAAGPGIQVICSGDGQGLAVALNRAIRSGCQGLISFGVAGGLAPNLRPGTCVVGSAILSAKSSRLPTDHSWSQRLLNTIPGAIYGPLFGVPAPIAEPEAKQALHYRTGAVAVDMESHVVANVAASHSMPMVAIRVITDPAKRALPKSALAAMRPDGTTDIAAMIRSVMRRPRELPALLQTALDARAARATLLRGRQLLGPSLGLPDFGEFELDVA
jgi:adenosylhomocysteine nucleosidase